VTAEVPLFVPFETIILFSKQFWGNSILLEEIRAFSLQWGILSEFY
jgi:hypothetical protein